jgi:hypothetical protein
MEALTLVGASFGVTTATDMLRNLLGDDGAKYPKWFWNVASGAIALLIPFVFNVQAAAVPDALRFGVEGAALQVWTGVILWGGSKFGHELMDRLHPGGHRLPRQ